MVGILALRVARAGVPVAVLWVGKLIVDQVVTAIALRQLPWRHLGVLLAIEFAIAVVGEGLSRLSALLESLLGDLFANRTSIDLMRHSATLDLEQFEDADLYDKLERARRQGSTARAVHARARDPAGPDHAGSHCGRAGGVRALAAGLLAVAVVPSLLGETHFASLGYSLLYSWTPNDACSIISATWEPATSRPRK